jgi:hypothetical protein
MYKTIIILLFTPLLLLAQPNGSDINTNLILKGVIYKKEFSVEAKLHTLGFAVGYNSGLIKSYHLTKFYHFDIGYLKSYKEKKNNLIVTGISAYKSYSYGKRNYFFPTKIGLGYKKYLSEKASYRGVAVGYTIEGGVNLGILKPYFIEVKQINEYDQPYIKEIKYSEENKNIFLNENLIYGKASFFNGFGDLSLVPGIHINAAMHYAFKAYEKPLFAVETGFMIDAFIKRVPIMVETSSFKNNSIFINVYISVQLGRRWN